MDTQVNNTIIHGRRMRLSAFIHAVDLLEIDFELGLKTLKKKIEEEKAELEQMESGRE